MKKLHNHLIPLIGPKSFNLSCINTNKFDITNKII